MKKEINELEKLLKEAMARVKKIKYSYYGNRAFEPYLFAYRSTATTGLNKITFDNVIVSDAWNGSQLLPESGVTKIKTDDKNNVYVATGTEIKKYNSAGGLVLTIDYTTTVENFVIDSEYNVIAHDGVGFKKYNSTGSLQFTKSFPVIFDIAVDSSNNIYALPNNSSNFTKYDSNGTVIWVKNLFYGSAMYIDNNDNIFTITGTGEFAANNLRKLDTDGNVLLSFGNNVDGIIPRISAYQDISWIITDYNGNIIVATGRAAYSRNYLWSFDSEGNYNWSIQISDTQQRGARSLVIDSSNNIYYTTDALAPYKIGIVKLNSSGSTVWSRTTNYEDTRLATYPLPYGTII